MIGRPISGARLRAIACGDKLYDSGKMCKLGHTTFRRVDNYGCPTCQRTIHRYPHDQACKERSKVAKRKKYREDAAYREYLIRRQKAHYERAKCDPILAERIRESNRRYYVSNTAKCRVLFLRRKQRERLSTPDWLTEVDFFRMSIFYLKARRLTELTSIPHEVDHIVPLQGKTVCGLNVPWNLQVLTSEENRRKRDGLPGAGELVCRKAAAYQPQPVSGSKKRTKPTTT